LIKNLHCGLEKCTPPKILYLYDISKMNMNLGLYKIYSDIQHIYYSILVPIINSDNVVLGYIGVDYSEADDFKNIIDSPTFQPCELCKFSVGLAISWESNMAAKDKILKYNRKIWKDVKGF